MFREDRNVGNQQSLVLLVGIVPGAPFISHVRPRLLSATVQRSREVTLRLSGARLMQQRRKKCARLDPSQMMVVPVTLFIVFNHFSYLLTGLLLCNVTYITLKANL